MTQLSYITHFSVWYPMEKIGMKKLYYQHKIEK